jgi:hypothetical protein
MNTRTRTGRARAIGSAAATLLFVLTGLTVAGGALAQGKPALDVVSPANDAAIH